MQLSCDKKTRAKDKNGPKTGLGPQTSEQLIHGERTAFGSFHPLKVKLVKDRYPSSRGSPAGSQKPHFGAS